MLRRLAAKCANNYVIGRRSMELQPQQLGAGVSCGAEAAVHATWRLVQQLPTDHVIVKLDYSNDVHCIRWDVILDAVAAKTPEIYRLVYATYSCDLGIRGSSTQIKGRCTIRRPIGITGILWSLTYSTGQLTVSSQDWFHGRHHTGRWLFNSWGRRQYNS